MKVIAYLLLGRRISNRFIIRPQVARNFDESTVSSTVVVDPCIILTNKSLQQFYGIHLIGLI